MSGKVLSGESGATDDLPTVRVIHGDCLTELRKLPAESVQCCVTSPPYWGLRDYGIVPTVWGGVEDCVHQFGSETTIRRSGGTASSGLGKYENGVTQAHIEAKVEARSLDASQGAFCAHCGAWRGCFGLEPTPELYVAHAVLIFAEVRRVLRKDGTLWVNLGDSYATGAGAVGQCPGGGEQGAKWAGKKGYKGDRGGHEGKHAYVNGSTHWAGQHPGRMKQNGLRTNVGAATGPLIQPNRMPIAGRKPGDLVGIPWLVAFALQADGWWLRRDNIWHKPSPMPESVNGWRWEQCRVKVKNGNRHKGVADGRNGQSPQSMGLSRAGRENPDEEMAVWEDCPGCKKCESSGGLVLRKGNWRCTTAHEYVFQFSKSADYFCDAEAGQEQTAGLATGNCSFKRSGSKRGVAHVNANNGTHRPDREDIQYRGPTRNRRSVWRVNTRPFKGAHFATFPPLLIEPIIRAATPPACCAACGQAFAPVIARGPADLDRQRACGGDVRGEYHGKNTKMYQQHRAQPASTVKARILAGMVEKQVTGYRATCRCGSKGGGASFLGPVRKGQAKDGPRYKALGNSMAVNCMRWIGERIQGVDAMVGTSSNPGTNGGSAPPAGDSRTKDEDEGRGRFPPPPRGTRNQDSSGARGLASASPREDEGASGGAQQLIPRTRNAPLP